MGYGIVTSSFWGGFLGTSRVQHGGCPLSCGPLLFFDPQVAALVRRVSDTRGVGPHRQTVLLLLVNSHPVPPARQALPIPCPPVTRNVLFICALCSAVGVFNSLRISLSCHHSDPRVLSLMDDEMYKFHHR